MNDNRFYQNGNEGYDSTPRSAAGEGYNNDYSNDPRRIDSAQFYSGEPASPQNGGRRPRKEKSPFLTKRAAAAALAVCVGAAGFFGFGLGMMTGSNNAAGQNNVVQSDPGVIQTAEDLSAQSGTLSVSDIVKKAQDSVVEIQTEVVQTNMFNQQVSGEAAGSGVIISEDGYIVTNNHVVEGGSSYTVRLSNGDSYDAQLIGRDPQMDLAVLKIEASGLSAAAFGDSGSLVAGDTTVAIGNPLGTLGGTVTNGIVSATNREITLEYGSINVIQTNAAINPGNSGGGLFNDKGELIGVVVAKSSMSNTEGLGFAIPSNDAKEIIDQLIENGYVKGRIDLGMTLVDVSTEQAARTYGLSSTGVYVAQVTNGSQAANLGIRSGDRIVSLGGVQITNAADLESALEKYSVGDKVEITIERSGRTAQTELTLQEQVPSSS